LNQFSILGLTLFYPANVLLQKRMKKLWLRSYLYVFGKNY